MKSFSLCVIQWHTRMPRHRRLHCAWVSLPDPSWRRYWRRITARENTQSPWSQGAHESVCSINGVRSGETGVLRISPSHPWVFQHPSQLSIHESPLLPHLRQNKPWLPSVPPSGRAGTIPFLPLGSQSIFHSDLKNPYFGPDSSQLRPDRGMGKGNDGGPLMKMGNGTDEHVRTQASGLLGAFNFPGWVNPASRLEKPSFGSGYYRFSPGWHAKNKDSPKALLRV